MNKINIFKEISDFFRANPNPPFLGLDWGRKRIGVAVSDKGLILASPIETISVASHSPSPLAGEGRGEGYKIAAHNEYKPYIKEFSRTLRKENTDAEKKLWNSLRSEQLGFKFRRQHPIDNKYIADFVCLNKRLIIELDGSQHFQSGKDNERTKYLKKQDFKVIRFWDNEVLKNLEGCLTVIHKECLKDTPHPSLLPQGEKEHLINSSTVKHLNTIITQRKIGGIVIGYPLEMSGNVGPVARQVEAFAEELSEIYPNIPILLKDERLSSFAAEEALNESGNYKHTKGKKNKKKKQNLDQAAAAFILQSVLDGKPRS